MIKETKIDSQDSVEYISGKQKQAQASEFRKNVTLEVLGSRVPPHSEDAEIAVLGALMMDNKAISKVLESLDEESFYDARHRTLFKTIISMFDKNITIDIVTLSEELYRNKLLDAVGGTYYLTEIDARTPTAANVDYYAKIVQERALKRKLIETAGQILDRSYDDATDALEEIDAAEQAIFRIADKRYQRGYSTIKKVTEKAVGLLQQIAERDYKAMTGIPTGYRKLDEILGGLQNSDLIILAGRPSMGKTALALSIARNIAVDEKQYVAFFSIEMSAVSLAMRLISNEAEINAHDIRTGNITDKHMKKIISNLDNIYLSPMIIDDSPTLTMMEFRSKCRRLKAEYDIKVVFLDYLQLVSSPKAESREREISIISSSLKQVAKELDIPIVALAQLNRSVESRGDKRPLLSDLRESGSIEQDADVVMFVNRPEFYSIKNYEDGMQTEGTAEIIVGKQRNGPIGTARLAFKKDFARFENLAFGFEEPPDAFGGSEADAEKTF